jgi:LysM repeat protein
VKHKVVKGDTVWALSIKYKTTVKAIIKANGLNSRATIRVGQKLTIPVKGTTVSSSGGSGGASASGGSTESPATPTTITHTVVKGDTVWGLSIKYKTSTGAIIKANNLGSNALIRVGQKLTIPVA